MQTGRNKSTNFLLKGFTFNQALKLFRYNVSHANQITSLPLAVSGHRKGNSPLTANLWLSSCIITNSNFNKARTVVRAKKGKTTLGSLPNSVTYCESEAKH